MNCEDGNEAENVTILAMAAALLSCAYLSSGCIAGIFEALWEADCNSRTRYQTPIERPYVIREIAIQGGVRDVKLAGELTLPHDPEPFPGVVLISGSELADRDSAILGHKPFLVLADYLTRRGFAVLRHDGRAPTAARMPARESEEHRKVLLAGNAFA